MGWPLYGLITLAAEQSNSPNRSQAGAVVQDPNCPGNDNHALMCRLVNEYRVKHGLKPVQFDGAVTREAQYWSDQLKVDNTREVGCEKASRWICCCEACWRDRFSHYHER